ncbi:MAG TPA: asparagine synthase (glutamine-hydrolyzing) [Longimicrobium sp.]
MCGIAGVAGPRAAVGDGVLERMLGALAHRGPDDQGVWISPDRTVALTHRRLSILDLSPAGHQPMEGPGGTRIVYNGEVYNFAELRDELRGRGFEFHSGSDTEVLLAAYAEWGERCVERLRGMFAFALHDPARRRLLLARDRAGEKPLFYHHAGGALRFGSELKALLADPAVPRTLDPEAFELYLAYGFVPGGRCILRGVHKLPPAHLAVYDLEADRLEVRPYWRLPAPPGERTPSADELVDELEALLLSSVREQLVADVPVAVLLSGGLDSSLVTAMAARASSKPVRTFTVSFPGHGGFDESAHARIVARHFGTEHHELPVEPASVELLPLLARQYDEPLADSSMVPTFLVSKLVREHATVALGGDGGDELFAGYGHYRWILRQEELRRVVPGPVRRAVGAAAAALPVGVRGRNHLVGFGRDRSASLAAVNLYFDARSRDALLARWRGRAPGRVTPEAYRGGLCADRGGALQQATAADFAVHLPDDILVKVDRASMLTSLEVRAPFLDHRIVELAFGRVPDALRATSREAKILPRLLAKRVLPKELDTSRKQGFSLPLASWFRGSWGSYIEEVLRSAPAELFAPAPVEALLSGQRRGLGNTHRLFALTIFELWRREYGVSFHG